MKIGVCIPCFFLTDYLDAVIRQFSDWGKVVVIEQNFQDVSEANVRNAGLNQLADHDLVWTVDADEFILKEDQKRIVEDMVNGKHDVGFCPVIDYKSKDTAIMQREHKPVVIVDPKTVRFYDGRCCHFHNQATFEYPVHHFGIMFSVEKLEWKMKNYWDTKPYSLMDSPTKPVSPPKEIMVALKGII